MSYSDVTAAETPEITKLELRNALAGWISTGIPLEVGDPFEVDARGMWDSEGLILAPRHVLWYRVSEDGTARNFPSDDLLAVSEASGELEIAIRPPSFYWFDKQGTFPPEILEAPEVAVSFNLEIRQSGALHSARQSEADKNLSQNFGRSEDRPPKHFKYLTILGESEVWSGRVVSNKYFVSANLKDDVGIIKMPANIELSGSMLFSFDWLYHSLPAVAPETSVVGHDYLSIALEFDNGQDLTWMWSKFLAKGTSFTCPLPWWSERETHYVLDSGSDGLGKWKSHSRNILDDYAEAVAGDPPKKIVGIWLIANNLFAKQDASASFRNITLMDEGEQVFSY
tara:strand:+ start:166 stop:1185 length:1020 start_codon:yes stop_codon:yes gene_type:complete